MTHRSVHSHPAASDGSTTLEGAVASLASTQSATEVVTVVEQTGQPAGSAINILVYKAWISANPGSRQLFAILYNLAVQYVAAQDWINAVDAFQRSLQAKADFHPAALSLGSTYEAAGSSDGALAAWKQALQPDPVRTDLLNNRGRVLENMKRLPEAEQEFRLSLLTTPNQPAVLHHWIGLRTRMCAWPVYETAIPGVTVADMVAATRALTLLAISDDIAIQSRGNASWIAEKLPPAPIRLAPETPYRHARLRIGYLSSDFCMHPIAYVIAELLELHDRDGFDIYGYCSTIDDGSEVRRRIVDAFDVFCDVRALDDERLARRIRDDEIDILVDLNGLTLGTRLQALRWKPAPVQITYLGYNGPIPLPELDYIIADRFVVPPEKAELYEPRPLYVSRCFQVNDRKVPIAPLETRADAGLPEDRFIFCCFSNTFKITEPIFEAWMAILNRCGHAVLWLYVDNAAAKANLIARASRCGVDRERIIFAERVEASLYRSRLALADVFLDTFPYNAGVTASDALRVGLPIVTLCGETFIARMAASLMTAMGVTEGIATSIPDYVERAVALASKAARYRALRAAVDPQRWTDTLGDTPAFTREIEALYEEVIERCFSAPPDERMAAPVLSAATA